MWPSSDRQVPGRPSLLVCEGLALVDILLEKFEEQDLQSARPEAGHCQTVWGRGLVGRCPSKSDKPSLNCGSAP